jgi:hypothetical protein
MPPREPACPSRYRRGIEKLLRGNLRPSRTFLLERGEFAMNIGAEIPFRRSRFARRTGSLIFDRQLDDRLRQSNEAGEAPMLIWSNGRFRAN